MKTALSAAMLALTAGSALAQPVIDGSLGSDPYGTLLWAQNQPTTFGNNVAGTLGTVGDPANVTKGVEFSIPMSVLGNPAAARIAGFINGGGHDFVSNQVIGSLPANTGNPGEPRNLNFNNYAGDQFATLDLTRTGTAPTIDGTRDAGIYGAPRFIQENYTGFGNNTQNTGVTANGSEIDAVYSIVYNNGTPADATDDVLYVFVAGNLESNFNKLDLFFDTAAGGQNNLRTDNAVIDFDGLNRMGNNGTQPGLTFDTGFAADHWVAVTTGGAPTALYFNYAQLLDTPGAGPGFYCGTAAPLSNGVLTGGDVGAPAVACSIDNSNTAGVGGGVTGITLPDNDVAAGSEIDGIYATVSGNKLYVLVTGNLETNYNKLDLFLDVNASEGQNVLRGDNVDIDYNGLNRMGTGGGGDATRPGLKFDAGFAADYFIGITNGSYPVENYTNAALLRADGPIYASGFILDYSSTHGGPKATIPMMNFPATYADPQDFSSTDPLNSDAAPRAAFNGQLTPGLIKVVIKNSNVGGVTGIDGTPSVADAPNVTTGVELELDLTELGWDGGPIRIAGFLNGTGHDFLSNQVIGGLPTPGVEPYAPSLGESATVDFSVIAGDQFVVVGTTPPCPGNECGSQDFNGDGDFGTDQDIEAFFACLGGNCCATCFCQGSDFNGDGDFGTDQDIEAFFRVLGGGNC
jgi:hypothetical protein